MSWLNLYIFIATKHVLQYLKDNIHYGMKYVGYDELSVHGFVDSDWVEDAHYRKIIFGFYFIFSSSVGSR